MTQVKYSQDAILNSHYSRKCTVTKYDMVDLYRYCVNFGF